MPKRRDNGNAITDGLEKIGNGGKWAGLLRLATPSGVIAIAAICIQIGSTLTSINTDIQQGCRNQQSITRALQLEHHDDRYRNLFRAVRVRCEK